MEQEVDVNRVVSFWSQRRLLFPGSSWSPDMASGRRHKPRAAQRPVSASQCCKNNTSTPLNTYTLKDGHGLVWRPGRTNQSSDWEQGEKSHWKSLWIMNRAVRIVDSFCHVLKLKRGRSKAWWEELSRKPLSEVVDRCVCTQLSLSGGYNGSKHKTFGCGFTAHK